MEVWGNGEEILSKVAEELVKGGTRYCVANSGLVVH